MNTGTHSCIPGGHDIVELNKYNQDLIPGVLKNCYRTLAVNILLTLDNL